MKRRSEHLVRKRDGRTEFLRATKLARSVHLALKSVGVDDDWRAQEVGAAVLAGVRRRLDPRAEMALPVAVEPGPGRSTGVEVTTEMLAEAVQRVLIANGQAAAAVARHEQTVSNTTGLVPKQSTLWITHINMSTCSIR